MFRLQVLQFVQSSSPRIRTVSMWRWSDRGGFLDRTQRREEILMEVDRTLAILSLSQLVTFPFR